MVKTYSASFHETPREQDREAARGKRIWQWGLFWILKGLLIAPPICQLNRPWSDMRFPGSACGLDMGHVSRKEPYSPLWGCNHRRLPTGRSFYPRFCGTLWQLFIWHFLTALRDLMESALAITPRQCKTKGLMVNPLKANIMVFTR
jgi:hypothetical protein